MLSKKQAMLKLDYDEPRKPPRKSMIEKLGRAGYSVESCEARRSPSGKGWHVVIAVSPRPRTAMEVVALQAVLGSDPWREAMQIARARAFPKCPPFMRDAWNVLYRADKRRARRINLRKALNRRKRHVV